MKKTEEKAVTISCTDRTLDHLNDHLMVGWKVKQMCAFGQSSAVSAAYATMIIILEREINT